MVDRRLEADLFGGSLLAPDVGCRGRIIAYLDDGDARTALVGVAFDGALQLIANGARVEAAVDQPGRHRLSLARQIADFHRPGDSHPEAGEVRQRRAFADPDSDLHHPGVLEDGGLEPRGGPVVEGRGVALLDL